MISLDSRRRTQSGPSNSRSGDQSLEETGAYSPAATSPPAVIVPAGPPAGRNRIDFLCTRRLPFEGDSVMAVLTSISTETPPAPKEGVLAVSRGMINGDGSSHLRLNAGARRYLGHLARRSALDLVSTSDGQSQRSADGRCHRDQQLHETVDC